MTTAATFLKVASVNSVGSTLPPTIAQDIQLSATPFAPVTGHLFGFSGIAGDPIAYKIITPISASDGLVTLNQATGAFTYDPNNKVPVLPLGASRHISFTFEAIDAKTNVASQPHTVTITLSDSIGVPMLPTINATTSENNPITFSTATLFGTVPGLTGVHTGETITGVSGAQHGVVKLNPNQTITFTPDANYIGPAEFTYNVTMANDLVVKDTVHITTTPSMPTSTKITHITLSNAVETLNFKLNFGTEDVTGFNPAGASHDTLSFDHHVFSSVTAVLAAATQHGTDLVIKDSYGDQLTLHNVVKAALVAADIHIA